MQKNNKGFSLPLAMGLVMIISLLAYTILEYIVPFSREIKGVENSSVAYYQANSGIEEGLYDVYTRNYSGALDDRNEYGDSIFTGNKNSKYQTYSSGNILPQPGEGNSRYDSDWNTISQGNPIQLSVGNNMISPDDLKIIFRKPSILASETLSGSSSSPDYLPIVNWQLSGVNDSLNASGAIITAYEIDNGNTINFGSLGNGVDLSGNSRSFEDFYGTNFLTGNCYGTNSGCILKFSVINKLETTDGVTLPFLEWQLSTDGHIIPDRFTKIQASGKSYGYKKDLEIKVPSLTVNEAFDFTVFQ